MSDAMGDSTPPPATRASHHCDSQSASHVRMRSLPAARVSPAASPGVSPAQTHLARARRLLDAHPPPLRDDHPPISRPLHHHSLSRIPHMLAPSSMRPITASALHTRALANIPASDATAPAAGGPGSTASPANGPGSTAAPPSSTLTASSCHPLTQDPLLRLPRSTSPPTPASYRPMPTPPAPTSYPHNNNNNHQHQHQPPSDSAPTSNLAYSLDPTASPPPSATHIPAPATVAASPPVAPQIPANVSPTNITRNVLLLNFGRGVPLLELFQKLQINGDIRHVLRPSNIDNATIAMYKRRSSARRLFQMVVASGILPPDQLHFVTATQITRIMQIPHQHPEVAPMLANQGCVRVDGLALEWRDLSTLRPFFGAFGNVVSITEIPSTPPATASAVDLASSTLMQPPPPPTTFSCIVEFDSTSEAEHAVKNLGCEHLHGSDVRASFCTPPSDSVNDTDDAYLLDFGVGSDSDVHSGITTNGETHNGYMSSDTQTVLARPPTPSRASPSFMVNSTVSHSPEAWAVAVNPEPAGVANKIHSVTSTDNIRAMSTNCGKHQIFQRRSGVDGSPGHRYSYSTDHVYGYTPTYSSYTQSAKRTLSKTSPPTSPIPPRSTGYGPRPATPTSVASASLSCSTLTAASSMHGASAYCGPGMIPSVMCTPTTMSTATASAAFHSSVTSMMGTPSATESAVMTRPEPLSPTPAADLMRLARSITARVPTSCLYDICLEDLATGRDTRSTLMIRHIPNKYTQNMFIDLLNETHFGCYDFVYLRMDFHNRCNVGYAFVNFLTSEAVLRFADRFAGRTWNRFRSEKRCGVSFATIQGRRALVEKFRNSSVMLELPEYRPKVFYTSGPARGEEAPFPGPTTSGYRPKIDVLFSRSGAWKPDSDDQLDDNLQEENHDQLQHAQQFHHQQPQNHFQQQHHHHLMQSSFMSLHQHMQHNDQQEYTGDTTFVTDSSFIPSLSSFATMSSLSLSPSPPRIVRSTPTEDFH